MAKVVGADETNIQVGLENGKLIEIPKKSLSAEFKVGDKVEIYRNEKKVIITKLDEESSSFDSGGSGEVETTRDIAKEKKTFAKKFPHLEGCVAAGFGKRFGRGLLLGAMIMIPFYIINFILNRVFGDYSVPTLLILAIVGIGLMVLQWIMIRRNGMNLPDYVTGTKWIDTKTGKPMSNKGLVLQLLVSPDGGGVVILLLAVVCSIIIMFAAASGDYYAIWQVLNVLGIISIIVYIAYAIACIVAWVQIGLDKATHRCWMDKVGGVIVVDTKLGRDPLKYKPFGIGKF